jgi:hypothetical protein
MQTAGEASASAVQPRWRAAKGFRYSSPGPVYLQHGACADQLVVLEQQG